MAFIQRIFILSSTFLILLVSAEICFADSSTKKESRKQTITFEDELVEGNTTKPDLFYLFQKKNFNFKRMMKLRNDFIPEMKRSTEDVQRGRGNL